MQEEKRKYYNSGGNIAASVNNNSNCNNINDSVNSNDIKNSCNNLNNNESSDNSNLNIKYGKITLIGTGPGDIKHLTRTAVEAIEECSVIIGYSTYLKQISNLLREEQKKLHFNMKDEITRCEAAISKSMEGENVAVVSGGDAGIYGMSGLLLELLDKKSLIGKIPLDFIPGVPAFCAAACSIGAPIMNDFCVISLSNLLTPWEDIEKRLDFASKGDFVIIIYNPKSAKRKDELTNAKEILLKNIDKNRPSAIVKAASRPDEEIVITTLEHIDEFDLISMNTTIIIGNSTTFVKDFYMITKRGYGNKYNL
ncbi:MAG: precorrin-3B C(17)-methyltransferase [Candidatus Acididesulfobacter diazotrophicus]|uniref:Precorrin-3B C(17)-methyltransferase n=1 Tax=Candidatus Acididesulfobacter diazotrophicus TaxID=2597226 RepID=A0A519BM66_9DELT|nr:MAG: precorrin-3B C(17)-methyltransferase [Candidatus Acididesulfobacter diazotrophicus]